MSTWKLNLVVRMAIDRNPPPIRRNRRPKIYFASQIDATPPTIVLKCNDPTLLDESWKRYFLGFLREATPFQEVPIRLVLRARGETDPDAAPTTPGYPGVAAETDEDAFGEATEFSEADESDSADQLPGDADFLLDEHDEEEFTDLEDPETTGGVHDYASE